MLRVLVFASAVLALVVLAASPALPAQQEQPAPAEAEAEASGLTYRLSDGWESWPEGKRKRIEAAMGEAVGIYNRYARFEKALRVSYVPDVPTADGNFNGHIRFGGTINARIALHEIAHTLGVGTTPAWSRLLSDGQWTGSRAAALIQGFDGPDTVLRGDRQHFWPYGLNYDREDGETARVRHVLLVERLCRDMGLDVFASDAD